jgi:hypothetical protein
MDWHEFSFVILPVVAAICVGWQGAVERLSVIYIEPNIGFGSDSEQRRGLGTTPFISRFAC